MAKISIKLGLPLPGQEQYSSFRADFGIIDIDTDDDVEEQCKKAIAALDVAAPYAEAGLAQETSNLSGITLEGVGLGEQFAAFRARFSPLWKKLTSRVDRLEGKTPADDEDEEEAPAKKSKDKKADKPAKKAGQPKKV